LSSPFIAVAACSRPAARYRLAAGTSLGHRERTVCVLWGAWGWRLPRISAVTPDLVPDELPDATSLCLSSPPTRRRPIRAAAVLLRQAPLDERRSVVRIAVRRKGNRRRHQVFHGRRSQHQPSYCCCGFPI
jgi:hypothetical protein